ncbi:MAG TPA: FAD-dependent oxidoreductase [Allosphingosinicella sp.]|nr:FAD-dependent oxidoreductase [Allosphingosinicella sp.]
MSQPTSEQVYWNATAAAPDFPQLSGDLNVDVAIIGGGIVGVTAARLLKDRGVKVAVLEARRVGREVTGKSTAKVTSQHGLIYQTLEQKFGEHGARLYADAQEAGVRKIHSLAEQHGIDADIEPKAAYVYTLDESYVSKIEKEAEVAQRLGLPASLTRETGLPFDVLAAIRFDDQAQFHPTKYVAGLAQTIPGGGCHIFENSRAIDWEPTKVVTREGSVTARHVIMATHLPLGQVGGYYTQNHPYAEPVIAAPLRTVPPGMYKSAEQPSHSIRTHRRGNGDVWGIVAGSGFKPGHGDDQRRYFEDIERWLTENFDAGPVQHRWVNEDYSPVDDAPYIGWSSSVGDAYLVATGFAAWGISKGTAAAMILADLVTGKDNPWLEIFDAARVKPIAGGPQFVKENVKVAAELVGGYLAGKPRSLGELARGEGAVLKIDGENVAAFRDETGQVHAVSAVCTHMGCILGWNEIDRTWDCPCHGSRFELGGEVMHGPAVKALEKKSL